jgi:hypothetical protein
VRSSALMRAFRMPPQVAIRPPTGRKRLKFLSSRSLRHARLKSWSFRTVCMIVAQRRADTTGYLQTYSGPIPMTFSVATRIDPGNGQEAQGDA